MHDRSDSKIGAPSVENKRWRYHGKQRSGTMIEKGASIVIEVD